MLHGQSAGAEDAFDLATLPEAPQLFDAVALQSGAGSGTTLCTDAQKIGEAYAQALNCSSDSVSLFLPAACATKIIVPVDYD